MGGQVIRLKRGEAGEKTVYSGDPPLVAMRFEEAGAKRIHVVDLDGAFEGRPRNWEALAHIRLAVRGEIEVGGGLRTEEDVETIFDMGFNYAVLGTSALSHRDLICKLVERYDERIIIGVDSKNGKIAVKGWVETTDATPADFARELQKIGVSTIIATDIAADGMMGGPNLEHLKTLADSTAMELIASGGVRDLTDLKAVHDLGCPNIIGAIVGRALYEKKLDVRDAAQAFA